MVDSAELKHQLRQPRLAEMIAGVLRDRILSGELRDGDMLPKQEQLLEEFRVSKPSIREALRILETEKLITVKRGNVGGAVVHHPSSENSAYLLAVVLEARGVTIADVATAREKLEPVCAALCARRPDRRVAVVPTLHDVQLRARDAIQDADEFSTRCLQFHQVLVQECGNETLITLVGMLESLYNLHLESESRARAAAGTFPGLKYRRRTLRSHEQVIELIDHGDADGAAAALRSHLQEVLDADTERSADAGGPLRAQPLFDRAGS
jgi:DNA-binding FadR family transcriptional regulator